MFVEEGFRLRFANGEVIDFYADNTQQKENWMKVLSETVGKDSASGKGWTDMVLEKERKEKMRAQLAPQLGQAKALRENANANSSQSQQPQRPRSQPENNRPGSGSKSAGSSPVKQQRPPPPVEKDAKHANAPQPRERGGHGSGRRDQVRSMIF